MLGEGREKRHHSLHDVLGCAISVAVREFAVLRLEIAMAPMIRLKVRLFHLGVVGIHG